jgi:N-acetylglucosaminyldiphosphoundecaprenol N-acetyl-beta-D-mannosaminyltransferase
MNPVKEFPTANVLNIRVDAIDMPRAVDRTRQMLRDERKAYICVAGVHGVMEAQRCPALARVYAGADLTIPDGMPLVWVGHAQGHRTMQRVTGPDFMVELFRRQEFANVKHYLYGGDDGVVEQLRDVLSRRFPHAHIVGTRTPPFRELSAAEERVLVAEIRSLKPDIIWVGVSCPKQELFMRRYLPLLDTKIMVGVGAAFDYHTGRIRDSADWMKRAGLQWLHRLLQDPKRLWKRYLRNNPPFICRIVWQLLLERLQRPAAQRQPAAAVLAPEKALRSNPEIQKESVRSSAVA